jgi:ubiquinone/menaquinone biosynthesis C-methylase UbiE
MSDLKSSVAAHFGATADAYRTSAVHARGADLARLVELAAPRSHDRVLDAGCGAGHTAAALAPFVAQVTALDLSERMLDAARTLAAERGLTNVAFRQGDVEALPFDGESLDLVVSRYSAHHWPNPHLALREIARVLRCNGSGRFVLSDIVSVEAPLVDTYLQAIELLRDGSHVRDHSAGQWQTMLEANGFVVETVEPFVCPLRFDEWVARMATPAPRVAMLKSLLAEAPDEVREALQVAPFDRGAATEHFVLPGALVVARLGSS